MCLPLEPYKVEREWKHAGLSCAVVQAQEAGHRCGYVRAPPGHAMHGKSWDDASHLHVHGGITFAEIEPCSEHEDGQGWWLGFDCAHFMDARFDPAVDLTQLQGYARERVEIERMFPNPPGMRAHYWTQAEVEAETERLAEQLAA